MPYSWYVYHVGFMCYTIVRLRWDGDLGRVVYDTYLTPKGKVKKFFFRYAAERVVECLNNKE